MSRRMFTGALVALLAACSGPDRNPVVPSPGAPVVSPPPTPLPTPMPTPSPEPSATPRVNRPPSVSLAFPGESSCHPYPQPCTVALRAVATDPDGDRLTYAWSGCTFGTDALADCRVTGPGTFEAVVEVRDPAGATARATAPVRGINLPPSRVFPPTLPAQASQRTVMLFGNVEDPESGFLCGSQYCLGASATGPCGPGVYLECTCLGGAYAEVRTTNGPGTCTVTVRVQDGEGAMGTTTTRFDVTPP